ncbi:MAG: hypothetical protein HY271_19965 [Deltaproteobacteria bacterium]|nr:hypothetical protein [Deltaproteobacteria bacterium]
MPRIENEDCYEEHGKFRRVGPSGGTLLRRLLLVGSGITFESAGVHEFKGLGDARELFRLTNPG